MITKGFEKNEAIVQEKNILGQKNLPLVKARADYSIPEIHYDSTFWSGYLLKEQIPLDVRVIDDLENHHNIPIEDQFYANASQWWTPNGLKKAYKKLETSPPKPSLDGNISIDLKGFKDAKFIGIAGDFNGWNPVQFFLKKTNDGWTGKLNLDPGTYHYKFIVDGKWIADPGNSKITNDKNKNSILEVN